VGGGYFSYIYTSVLCSSCLNRIQCLKCCDDTSY
jgi:hypothetical protein